MLELPGVTPTISAESRGWFEPVELRVNDKRFGENSVFGRCWASRSLQWNLNCCIIPSQFHRPTHIINSVIKFSIQSKWNNSFINDHDANIPVLIFLFVAIKHYYHFSYVMTGLSHPDSKSWPTVRHPRHWQLGFFHVWCLSQKWVLMDIWKFELPTRLVQITLYFLSIFMDFYDL